MSEDHLVEEWEALLLWSLQIALPINFEKTKLVDIITKPSLILTSLTGPQEKIIEVVNSAILLGVTLSSNLKWDVHIKNVVSKANRAVFPVLMMKRCGISSITLWHLYFALVRSILSYACSTTCNMPQILFSQLERVEKRVSRIIGSPPPISLRSFVLAVNSRLAHFIMSREDHPLHHLFEICGRRGRSNSRFTSHYAKTSRYKNSFIKYASPSH
jgi:hypothetical protein